MDTRTQRRLRLDRRLTDRRGWIASEDLERELAALPDVSEKAVVADAEEAGSATRAPEDAGGSPPPPDPE